MLNLEIEAKLKEFLSLEDNWDGHNAPKLAPESVETFKNFLKLISKFHGDISPESAINASYVNWNYEDEEVYADCLFLESNQANLYLHFKDDKNSVGLEHISIDDVKKTLTQFAPVLTQ